MIPWEELDERERAVWSATVAAQYVKFGGNCEFEFAMNLADRAVYALREVTKKGPY